RPTSSTLFPYTTLFRSDVNFAKKGQHVVLAEAEHLDIFHDHHFVVTDRKQRLLQHGVWIFFVALGQKFEGAVDAMRSADETFAGDRKSTRLNSSHVKIS